VSGKPQVDLYAFPADAPQHLTNCAEVYDYKPYYKYFLGGVVVISIEHIVLINGFHNGFEGWGGEDDHLM
jgi:N-terminal domain of galactosyltransferase